MSEPILPKNDQIPADAEDEISIASRRTRRVKTPSKKHDSDDEEMAEASEDDEQLDDSDEDPSWGGLDGVPPPVKKDGRGRPPKNRLAQQRRDHSESEEDEYSDSETKGKKKSLLAAARNNPPTPNNGGFWSNNQNNSTPSNAKTWTPSGYSPMYSNDPQSVQYNSQMRQQYPTTGQPMGPSTQASITNNIFQLAQQNPLLQQSLLQNYQNVQNFKNLQALKNLSQGLQLQNQNAVNQGNPNASQQALQQQQLIKQQFAMQMLAQQQQAQQRQRQIAAITGKDVTSIFPQVGTTSTPSNSTGTINAPPPLLSIPALSNASNQAALSSPNTLPSLNTHTSSTVPSTTTSTLPGTSSLLGNSNGHPGTNMANPLSGNTLPGATNLPGMNPTIATHSGTSSLPGTSNLSGILNAPTTSSTSSMGTSIPPMSHTPLSSLKPNTLPSMSTIPLGNATTLPSISAASGTNPSSNNTLLPSQTPSTQQASILSAIAGKGTFADINVAISNQVTLQQQQVQSGSIQIQQILASQLKTPGYFNGKKIEVLPNAPKVDPQTLMNAAIAFHNQLQGQSLPSSPMYNLPFRANNRVWNTAALNPELNPVSRPVNNQIGTPDPRYVSISLTNQNPNMPYNNNVMPTTPMRSGTPYYQQQQPQQPRYEEPVETDPQKQAMSSLVRKCETYSNQIKSIVHQWHEKTKSKQENLKEKDKNELNSTPSAPATTTTINPDGTVTTTTTETPSKEQELDLITQPENLQYELRAYQLVGLNWLYLLFQKRINGILADEMGLGKTIQTIALFSLLKQRGEVKKPHIIIAPATALENWVREFSVWCPSLTIAMYHGTSRERDLLRKQLLSGIQTTGEGSSSITTYPFDVVITTYNLCITKLDRVKFFKKIDFSYIVLDEAHNIKNVASSRYQSLLKLAFRAEFRLMLTGTPLQNNMNELWALMNFLMPSIFSCTQDYKSFSWGDDGNSNANTPTAHRDQMKRAVEVERVKRIISPFILRRLKSEVLTKLPPKQETVIYSDMTASQREFYQRMLLSSKSNYNHVSDPKVKNEEEEKKEQTVKVEKEENGKEEGDEKTLHHILMQLRKAANNQLLFRIHYDDAKLKEIEDIIKEAEEKGYFERKAKEEEEQERIKAEQDQLELEQKEPEQSEDKMETEQSQSQSQSQTIDSEPQSETVTQPLTESQSNESPVETNDKMEEVEEAKTRPKSTNNETLETDAPVVGTQTQPLEGEEASENENENENAEAQEEDEDVVMNDDEVINDEEETDGCSVCYKDGNLLVCDGPCNRMFHFECAGLEQEPTEDKWFCEDCEMIKEEIIPSEPAKEGEETTLPVLTRSKDSPNYAEIQAILQKLISARTKDKSKRKRSTMFMYIPLKSEYPEYYEMIANPISFNQIKNKYYETIDAFKADVLLLIQNAKTFNMQKSQVYKDAQAFEELLNEELDNFTGENNNEPSSAKKKRGPKRSTTTIKRTPSSSTRSKRAPEELRRSSRSFKKSAKDDDNYEMDEENNEGDNGDNDDLEENAGKKKRSRRDMSRTSSGGRKRLKTNHSYDDDDDEVDADDLNTPSKRSLRPRTPSTSNKKKLTRVYNFGDSSDDEGLTSKQEESRLGKKKKLKEPFNTCRNVLEDLIDQDDSEPFHEPVDYVKLKIPDYLEIIKQPMDLGTVWTKLNNSECTSVEAFMEDVRLVFDNCLLYNEPTSDIGRIAQMLWTYFKRQCRKEKLKVPESKSQLANKNMKISSFKFISEELKVQSDMEIHRFCEKFDILNRFRLTDEQIFNSSGKLIDIHKLLADFKEKGSRVLIFSQFTQVLDILEEYMDRAGHKFLRMDGSTPVLDRQTLIDEYNTNRDVFVFLLSTRAAGIGINLTTANICIFHDIDWNPEMDRQAEARVHRIGQTKQVQIVKLLAKGSIDEHIAKLSQDKKDRNDLLMNESADAASDNKSQNKELEKLSIGKVLASIFDPTDKS